MLVQYLCFFQKVFLSYVRLKLFSGDAFHIICWELNWLHLLLYAWSSTYFSGDSKKDDHKTASIQRKSIATDVHVTSIRLL